MLEAWVIGLHLATAHAGQQVPMNAATPGLYLKAPNGWAGGAYRNSLGNASLWVGKVFETADKRWALTVGAVTGYQRREGQRYCRHGFRHVAWNPCVLGDSEPVRPLLAPSVRLPITDNVAARLSYMPKFGDGAHALHLSLEF